MTTFSAFPLGGDWGGSMSRDGGGIGRGLSGGGGPSRFEGRGDPSGAAKSWIPRLFAPSLGFVFRGMAGGSLVEAAASRGVSSFGAGEIERVGGGPVSASAGLLMFSKRARREETGLLGSG